MSTSAGAAAVSLCAQWVTGRRGISSVLTAVGTLLGVLAAVLAASRLHAVLFAAETATALWLLRHGGPKGGSRKRLKSLKRRFTGVRRTAPT